MLQAGGRRLVADRFGGGSYLSANDPRLHFGLGASERIDDVEVRWPSGQVDRHHDLEADAIYHLREGDSTAKRILGRPDTESRRKVRSDGQSERGVQASSVIGA